MGCSRQEYWNGFSAPNPGMEPTFLCLLHWQVGSLPLTTPGKPHMCVCMYIYRYVCMCAKSLQLCLTLCGLMNCSPPGSSVHGILQAGILEWVGMSSPGGSSWPRDRTWVSCIAGRFFTIWATREAPYTYVYIQLYIHIHITVICIYTHTYMCVYIHIDVWIYITYI